MSPVGTSRIESRLESALSGKVEPETIRQYRALLRRFCNSTGKNHGWTQAETAAYLTSLLNNGLAASSVIRIYWALRSILRALGEDYELQRKDLGRIYVRQRRQSVLDKEEVAALVKYTLAYGDANEKLYLCLSTLYGLRREELHRVGPNDVKPESIEVHTAKHGEEREQWIPVEVRPLVFSLLPQATFGIPVTTLNYIYNRLVKNAGLERQERQGWHTIRRSLVTDLGDVPEISDRLITRFLRWSPGKTMIDRYTTRRSDMASDQAVFKYHPYLELWI